MFWLCSDVDATMLACIAFSCPNLQSLEIFTSDNSVNRITGYHYNLLFPPNLDIICSIPNLYYFLMGNPPLNSIFDCQWVIIIKDFSIDFFMVDLLM